MTTTETLIEKNTHSFPIGYYELHPDVSINYQLNRFYNWVGDPGMLEEMREATAEEKGPAEEQAVIIVEPERVIPFPPQTDTSERK